MLAPVVAEMRASIGEFSAKMAEARGEMDATAAHGESKFGAIGRAGVVALTGAAVSAVAVGGVLTHMAGDFQEKTTQIVTGAGESEGALEMIRQGLLDMASQVGQTPDELAAGLYNIESAGFHGAAGLDILRVAAEGAKVGGADMAVVADALTSAMNAYKGSGLTATQVTNDLIATVASGKMHMGDLAGALGKILPAASTAHVSLAEVTGAMATMTMQGTPAADAATYLRQMLLQLENPSHKAQQAMKDIGLSAHDVSEELMHKGLVATLETINTALSKTFPEDAKIAVAEFAKVKAGTETADEALANLSNNTTPDFIAHLANMVGGTKSMQAALELTGANLPVFAANVKTINDAVAEGGTEVRGWALVQDDFNTKLDQAKARAEAFGIEAGTHLLPVLSKGLDWIGKDGVGHLQDFGKVIQDDVIPVAREMWQWFDAHIVPAAMTVGKELFKIGLFIKDNLVPPALALVHEVGPPLEAVFGFIAEHGVIVEVVLGTLAARFVMMKAIGIASEVLAWGSAFRTFATAEGPIKAVSAALGMGGSGGLSGALRGVKSEMEGFGAAGAGGGFSVISKGAKDAEQDVAKLAGEGGAIRAADKELTNLAEHGAKDAAGALGKGAGGLGAELEMMGPAAMSMGPIAGIAALGVAIVGLGTDAGGIRTSLKNAIFGLSDEAAWATVQGDVKAHMSDIVSSMSMTGSQIGIAQVLNDEAKKIGLGNEEVMMKMQADAMAVASGEMSAADAAQKWHDKIPALGDAMQKLRTESDQALKDIIANMAQATNQATSDTASTAASLQGRIADISRAMGLSAQDALDWLTKHDVKVGDLMTKWQMFSSTTHGTFDQFLADAQISINGLDPMGHAIQTNLIDSMINAKQAADDAANLTIDRLHGIQAAAVAAGGSINDVAWAWRNERNAAADAAGGGGGAPGGPRAGGGPVQAGVTYLVGEEGPELWTAPADGTIVPHDALMSSDSMMAVGAGGGGGGGTNIFVGTVSVYGVQDIKSLTAEMRREAVRQARGQGVPSLWGGTSVGASGYGGAA